MQLCKFYFSFRIILRNRDEYEMETHSHCQMPRQQCPSDIMKWDIVNEWTKPWPRLKWKANEAQYVKYNILQCL